MINVSNEFKQLMQSRTDFKEYAQITLTNGTVLTLDETQFTVTNNSITDGAGLSTLPVGVAVQKIAQLEILNDQEQWDGFDFFGAKIRLYMTFALSKTTEKIERGIYTVVTPETWGETVIITAYDDMYKADVKYAPSLNFPATIQNMLIDICNVCGISLLSTSIPNGSYIVKSQPDSQYTARQIIGFIAMIAGGNARINNAGQLCIIPFSQIRNNKYYSSDLSQSIIYDAPEIVLNAWSNVSVEKNDITITGVALKQKTSSGDKTTLNGESGYVITVENPLIAGTDTEISTGLFQIAKSLTGMKFRKFSGTSISNPLVEFMDFVIVVDRRGRMYKSFITDVTFTFVGSSNVKNASASPVRNDATYYSSTVSSDIRARQLVTEERNAREIAVEHLSNAIANSSGLYESAVEQPDGSTIYYLHDKPTMAESKTVIKLTADAIGVSTDGGKTYPYGFTVTGEMVTRILNSEGINADWIRSGAFTIRDSTGKEIFSANMDTKTVNMSSTNVKIDGQSIMSVFSEQATKIKIGIRNLVRQSVAMNFESYYLVPNDSDVAFVGSAIVGTSKIE